MPRVGSSRPSNVLAELSPYSSKNNSIQAK
nr:MAG TPA: hypothetical protein [Crassvirales sp.]